MQLKADVVALSETSATHAVQNQTDHDMRGCGFRAFWSSDVSAKKYPLKIVRLCVGKLWDLQFSTICHHENHVQLVMGDATNFNGYY